MRPGLFKLLCAVMLCGSVQGAGPELRGLHEDIPIGEIDGVALSINIAFPQEQGAQPRPVLVVIHGGGFLRGDKAQKNGDIERAAARGYVAASVMYRLAPEHTFPAALDDVKLAIRFLKAHAAEYHLDPQRIIVSGASAGGYLAIMAGVTGNSDAFSDHGLYTAVDSSVRAVAAQSAPVADFTKPEYSTWFGVDRLLKPDEKTLDQALAAISAVTYLDPADPPLFLSHGDADPLVPVEISREFVHELETREHVFEYHEVEGGAHSLTQSVPDSARVVFDAQRKFVDRWSR